jgi:hypothetical protein
MDRLTVDAAHLLGDHDGRGAVVGSPDSRDREAVPQTLKIAGALSNLEFFLIDNPRVVEVTSGDDWMSSQAHHGSESFSMLVVLHQPTQQRKFASVRISCAR